MGWQKTFTLSKRAKGCHLVTNEVLNQIEPGLKGVQVASFSKLPNSSLSKQIASGGNAVPLHVSRIWHTRVSDDDYPHLPLL